MRIWIDVANSPHPLIFSPVARRLEERGHQVLVTARDHAQTLDLARARWPASELVGSESPAGRFRKGQALLGRIRGLRRWALSRRPDVALSHNSYAQICAARSMRLPVVTAMDFEHQPSNHLAFRLADVVLVPEAYPPEAARRQGASTGKLVRYPGLKESLYLGDFEADDDVLASLGIEDTSADRLVIARTPPSRAIYHRLDNPLFEACLNALDEAGHTTVVLPRHPEQNDAIRGLGLSRCIVASATLDSRSLMLRAGLFLGAGGTMTREAALLGLRSVTVFAGEVPAVDRWLEERDLIQRVTDARELPALAARPGTARTPAELRTEAEPILERFVAAVEGVAG